MTRANLGHMPFLDLLRGCSVFFVFAYHSLAEAFTPHTISWDGQFRDFGVSGSLLLSVPLQFGWMGVATFFVVSGFCVHLSWLRSAKEGWTAFLTRRFLRIYPPYLVVLVLMSLVHGWALLPADPSLTPANFLAHLVLLHNLNPTSIYSYAVSFWSIAVEFQLYLLYPLVILLRKRLGWNTCLAILLSCEIGLRGTESVLLAVDATLPASLMNSPFAYWFSWTLGAFLADNLATGRKSILDGVPAWIPGCFLFASFLVRPLEPLDFLFAAVLTYVLLGKILRAGGWSPATRLAVRWSEHASRVGVLSYSIYLFHEPILKLGMRGLDLLGTENSHPLVRLALCFLFWPVSVAAGRFSHRWLELPSISFGRRLASHLIAGR